MLPSAKHQNKTTEIILYHQDLVRILRDASCPLWLKRSGLINGP
jgi:hypothetical protein